MGSRGKDPQSSMVGVSHQARVMNSRTVDKSCLKTTYIEKISLLYNDIPNNIKIVMILLQAYVFMTLRVWPYSLTKCEPVIIWESHSKHTLSLATVQYTTDYGLIY